MLFTRQRTAWLAIGLVAGCIGAGSPLVLAEKVMDTPDEPLAVTLKTPLAWETLCEGEPFEATLVESYRYKDAVIPAGAMFRGRVTGLKESRRLYRSGYLQLTTDSVELPNGAAVSFEDKVQGKGQGKPSAKVRHPGGKTAKQAVVGELPLRGVSAAVAVPLRYAANMNPWVIYPITVGARTLAATTSEFLKKDNASMPWTEKVEAGVRDGTGWSTLESAVTKSPNPSLNPGDNVNLYLGEAKMRQLFRVADPPQD